MIFKACAFALVAVFCTVIIRELGWRGAGIMGAVCAVILFSLAVEGVSEAAKEIKSLSAVAELSKFAKCVLKIVGIGYVYGISSDICKDMGEGAVASALGTVGRIEILLAVLPFFKEILDFGLRLLG